MADYESLLISKAIQSGKLADIVTRGIEPEHFLDDYLRELYEWALEFMRDHGAAPSLSAVKQEFPGFKPKFSKDPLTYHMEQFVRHVKEVRAIELVRLYHDVLDDPLMMDDIEVHALDMARQLSEVVPAPRAEKLSDGTRRKENYYRRREKNEQHGIRLGIPTYDEITVGLQPHELLIFGGPPGGGKTTGQQHVALQAYLQGRTVLFVSLEVEAEQILRRFDTMLAKVRGRALKALELNPKEEERWLGWLEKCEREKMEHDIIIRDDIKNCSVEKVGAEQLRYSPGMVVVDYLEEMRTPRGVAGWEGVAQNGRGLKQAARLTKIPHVTATQLNREGETAYQSAQKIADMLIILQPDEEDEVKNEMELLLRKYRDGPSRRVVKMRWDIENGDIHEIGVDSRFPERRGKSLVGRKNGKPTEPVKGALGVLRAKRSG